MWNKAFSAVSPNVAEICRDVEEFKRHHPGKSVYELSKEWADNQVFNYTMLGAVSALPSAIPGPGTLVQICIEATTVPIDLAYMLRWMYTMVVGIGIINGRDMSTDSNQQVLKILGLWCGVLQPAKVLLFTRVKKAAVVAFDKAISGEIFKKINQKVGTTFLTKWGTKRGGFAVGKCIPFFVGSCVGSLFNYFVMKGFEKYALKHFATDKFKINE